MSQKNFDPVQMECIQIIHDHHHWVVSSYTGGSVRYADSLDRKLSEYVIQQLRQLYARCIDRQKDVLNIEVVPCQQQPNASDCGVFAAAFAFEWALGNQSLDVNFDVPRMRDHLIQCIGDELIVSFPHMASKKRGQKGEIPD